MKFNLINNSLYSVIFLIYCSLKVKSTEDIFASPYAKQILKLSKAADIKAYLNENIDPCEDFYTYVCGKWPIINPTNENRKIRTDKFQDISKGIEKRLNRLLLEEKSGKDDGEDKIKDFYASCRNVYFNKETYKKTLANIYKDFGEFSAFKTEEQVNNNNSKWWATVARIQYKYAKTIILSVFILDDIKNTSKTIPYISPPEFKLANGGDNMMQNMETTLIRKYLQSYLHMAAEDAAITAQNIITFENNLTWGATDVRLGKSVDELLTLYDTIDLIEKYKYLFDVKEYLEIVLGTKDLPAQIYVYDESYLEGLHDIFNTTDTELVEDYILWLFLEEFIVDLRHSDFQLDCIDQTRKYFGKFVDHVIYNQYRSKEFENDIYELWDNIKSTLRHNFESKKYDWISPETKQEAIKKLNNMNLSLNSYDNDNFIEMFKNLHIDPSNYVLNVKNILQHAESLRENKLEKKTQEDTELLSYTPVYNVLANKIKIPISMLQPYFIWDPVYPKAIQYGTLGYLIAHEVIHGFDDEGRNYDSLGRVFNWWDETSAKEFEFKRKCFEEQYHNYKYDGKPLAKSVLQSENIADNGGVNIAYGAYMRWLNKQKLSKSHVEANDTLPRLPFNNRQLFFISFAQLLCEDTLSTFRSTYANDDIHAPPMYRVIGSLSNSKQFNWLFKCDNRTCNMNPTKKCQIY
ncbi:endothelin-converting enzyme 1-like [Lucilia sericata]|uniref:endothelin-converting enzyme 1-like n=1 Tax=Lucilia sericata TaxID=13632 RepID=UPI0018A811CD|nr:endothelin-converting enzyme 1-like [Lucilia sericata]